MPAESISRIDELVRQAEAVPDPAARRAAIELAQGVMQLHAGALGRILEILSRQGDRATLDALIADELVSGILVLHDLHPHSFEARIRGAMDKLRRHFDSRGAGIELLGIEAATVRVRFAGSRPGAGAAARHIIEDVLYEAAPEIESLVIEGTEDPQQQDGFVPLSALVERHAV